jgi:magnesium-transporting ATPase (P-type)
VIVSLYGLLPSEINVNRGGRFRLVPGTELVPGDILQINAGSKVPADMRLFDVSADLKFNKSVLTGDAKAVKATVDRTSVNFLEVLNSFITHCSRKTLLFKERIAIAASDLEWLFKLEMQLFLDELQNCLPKGSQA